MHEIKTLWIVDFNGTFGKHPNPLPKLVLGSVNGDPLTQPQYDLLKRPVPEIEAWETIRPINVENTRVRYNPRRFERTLNAALGFTVPPRPMLPPIAQWVRLQKFLGYSDETIDKIQSYYETKITQESALSRLQRARRWWRMTDDNMKYITPFTIVPEEHSALMIRSAIGDEFTFATGLVEHSESDFIYHLDKAGTWDIIKNNNPPGFLRVADRLKNPNNIFYKCMVYTLMDQYVKARNAEYRDKGINTTLVLKGIDDHYAFVRTVLPLIDGLEMHLPISEDKAKRQRETISLIPALACKTGHKDPVFESGLALAA